MALTKPELEIFRKEIDATSEEVTDSAVKLIMSGVSPYGIVFGLMKVAAFIAKLTGCPEDVFSRLCAVAYKSETKSKSIDKQLDDLLNKTDKPKDKPN